MTKAVMVMVSAALHMRMANAGARSRLKIGGNIVKYSTARINKTVRRRN